MNGYMPLPAFLGRQYTVFGGPYRNKPSRMAGVKMAIEIHAACDVNVPTADFSVPDKLMLLKGLEKAVDLIAQGKPVYVGCMGGIGRTGLFLAALAKAWGEKDPVGYVRQHYIPHAVETREQQAYIAKLHFHPKLQRKVFWAKARGLLSFRKLLTH